MPREGRVVERYCDLHDAIVSAQGWRDRFGRDALVYAVAASGRSALVLVLD